MRYKVCIAFVVLIVCLYAGSLNSMESAVAYYDKINQKVTYEQRFSIPNAEKVLQGEIWITADYSSSCVVSISINNVDCNPREFKLQEKASGYTSKFICPLSLENTLLLVSSCDAKNVVIEYKATVEKEQEFIPSMTVKGTEYMPDDNGKTMVLLTNENGQPILNATCYLKIFYPNESVYIYNAPMRLIENADIYVFDFVVPGELGVYPEVVRCSYDYSFRYYNASSGAVLVGTEAGTYVNTFLIDDVVHRIDEKGKTFDVRYNFTNVSLNDNTTELAIFMRYKWDRKNDPINVYLWNFLSNGWVYMFSCGNAVNYRDCGVVITEGMSNYVDNGRVLVKMNDSNKIEADGVFRLDYLNLRTATAYYRTINLYGTGEIHVSNRTIDASQVWHYENRTLTMNITYPECNLTTVSVCECGRENMTTVNCTIVSDKVAENDYVGETKGLIIGYDKIGILMISAVMLILVLGAFGVFRI